MPPIELFTTASPSTATPLSTTSERTIFLASLFHMAEKGLKFAFLQRPSTYFLAGAIIFTLLVVCTVVMSDRRRRCSSDETWNDEKPDSISSCCEDTVDRKHRVRPMSDSLLGSDVLGMHTTPNIATTDSKIQHQHGARRMSAPTGRNFSPPGPPPLPFPNMLANILPHPTIHPFDHRPSPPPFKPLAPSIAQAQPPSPPPPQGLCYQDRKVMTYWTDPQRQLQKQEYASMVFKGAGGVRRHIRVYGSSHYA